MRENSLLKIMHRVITCAVWMLAALYALSSCETTTPANASPSVVEPKDMVTDTVQGVGVIILNWQTGQVTGAVIRKITADANGSTVKLATEVLTRQPPRLEGTDTIPGGLQWINLPENLILSFKEEPK